MTIPATTQTGVEPTNVTADEPAPFDAAEAFFQNLTRGTEARASTEADGQVQKDGRKEGETETPQETTEETTEDPAATATETQTETAAETARRQAADDDEVVVQVGEEAKRVSVKDLKRLFGQEAALTRKSQEVSATRTAVDAEAQKYAAGLEKMATDAASRWAAYEKIDYLLAKDAMDATAFANLRQDAQAAFTQHRFFQQEVQNFSTTMQTRQREAHQAAVVAAKAALADAASPTHIPDFNDAAHSEIVRFAAEDLGAPEDQVRLITAPWALKALHLAAQQMKAAKAAKAAKPTPVVKANSGAPVANREAPAATGGAEGNKRAALNKLRQTGSVDDAADAFLASWGAK